MHKVSYFGQVAGILLTILKVQVLSMKFFWSRESFDVFFAHLVRARLARARLVRARLTLILELARLARVRLARARLTRCPNPPGPPVLPPLIITISSSIKHQLQN